MSAALTSMSVHGSAHMGFLKSYFVSEPMRFVTLHSSIYDFCFYLVIC